MKLSTYARHGGVTDKTAGPGWKAGQVEASQRPTGTSMVRAPVRPVHGVALYARVSRADQTDDARRQRHRLQAYAAARGSQVVAAVTEIAASLHDERPQLKPLLSDAPVGRLLVEPKDRLTRCGSGYIVPRLEQQGRRVEAIFPRDTGDGLEQEFVAVIPRMAARIYGRRHARQRADPVQGCVDQALRSEANE